MDKKKKKQANRQDRKSLRPRLISVLIVLATGLLLAFMLAYSVTPEQYDLQVDQASPITITASRDVEDAVTTQALIDQAVAAVQPYYRNDTTVAPAVLADLDAAFTALESLRGGETEDVLTEGESALPELTEEEMDALRSLSAEELADLHEQLSALTGAVLASNLPEGQESETIAKMCKDLASDGLSEAQVTVAQALLSAYLRPNMFLDEEVTEENRQKAAESVEHIVYIKGRNIVRAGEIVTPAQIAMLDSLGMLKNRSVDKLIYAGIALLIVMVMLVLMGYVAMFEKKRALDPMFLALLCTILLVTAFICLLVQSINIYLMPVAIGCMLTALLVGTRMSLVVNLALAVITCQLAAGSGSVFTASVMSVLLTSALSGPLCLIVLQKRQQRLSVLLAGVCVALGNFAIALACGLITSTDTHVALTAALWAAASGILSSVLCIGLQPALEWLFNLLTTSKLLELSNPNHPLIRRLILEASGTYHHSIIVANLAEAAADSIGANGLLARVGAYYHDVGKLKRPLYFKENQMGDNPHDRTDPLVSAAILTAHPRDGMAMAQKERIPRPILDIIEQHHGDTPVIYFYDKALKQYGEEHIHVEDFRYAGPKPQTAEAAIVMLADTVEAAARSMQEPTLEKMNALIHKLVRAKMDDGQLDESPLTMKDLSRITAAFMTVLQGVFHERVEYPTVNIAPRNGELPAAPASPVAQPGKAPSPVAEPAKPAPAPAPQPAQSAPEPKAEPHVPTAQEEAENA